MSDRTAVESARRQFTGKRAGTLEKLCRATIEGLHEVGYHELSLRAVAARAGVARATAYIYFGSKDHLVAEVFWRRLAAEATPWADLTDPTERLVAVMRYLALLVADDPAMAQAATAALNSADPDVAHLRHQINRQVHGLMATAAGPDVDPLDLRMLELAYSGAMLHAGIGGMSYSNTADELEAMVRRTLNR